jgi:hypothetical protein
MPSDGNRADHLAEGAHATFAGVPGDKAAALYEF